MEGQYFDTPTHNLVQLCGNRFHWLRGLCLFHLCTRSQGSYEIPLETGDRSVSLLGTDTDKLPPYVNHQLILDKREPQDDDEKSDEDTDGDLTAEYHPAQWGSDDWLYIKI